jgi:ketosteroid isomerase-like protein
METLIRNLYASFNAKDIEAVLSHLDADVDWPNAWEGGRLRGHDAVRDYWTRQFAAIDPRVEPLEITTAGDQTAVVVRQTVRSPSGEIVAEGTVTHTYTVRDGRIVRMDVSD